MTANQRKKRVNAASLVGCTSYEQYMVKRKKLKLPQTALKMAPTISLEWDNKKNSVVSKRDQIGISQRHWVPYIAPVPRNHIILADVFSVPHEIFELENLSKVLSFEVWQSLLSKSERTLLSQFLPKEAEPDTLVQELLAGDNFHFGNPFLIWGASLCFGELHPDNVLHEEQSLKACKKEYRSYLQKYHNDMIGNLQLLKEKWASCKDSEVDIVHKLWRTRNYTQKSNLLLDTGFYDVEENLVATPESCSWANSEKEYGSENHNLEMVHRDIERRKDSLNKKGDNAFSQEKVASISGKGGKSHKHNIQHEDGAKYMSYVKVSKQQHERVKSSMKHNGCSIQPMSLNNVLGTIDILNVQPFEKFEKEEEKKLHDYWLKLVNSDVPDAFVNRRKYRLSRQLLIQSLGEEMGQKVKPVEATLDWDRERSSNKLMELSDDSKYEFLPAITIEGMEKEQFDDMLSEQRDDELAIDEIEIVQQGEKIRKTDYVFEEQVQDPVRIEHGNMPDHVCIQDHHQQQVASIDKSSTHNAEVIETCNPVVPQDKHQQENGSANGKLQIKPLEMESLVSSASEEIDDTPTLQVYSENLTHANVPVSHRVSLTSASDVWPTDDSYYQSAAASDGYASSQELKLGRTQFIQGQSLRILDMETDRQDKDAGKDILPRRSDHTFFSSYSNQDRSEPHAFFTGQNSLSYHDEQKHLGLDFQPANDLVDTCQFHGHLTEQVHPSHHLYPRPKRLNDLYVHQTLQESMYSDGNRFKMPRQEQVPVHIHDWAGVNSVSMAATSQPHLDSLELNQNWYSGEGGAQDVWAPYGSAAHSGGCNSDQSLFSVLSECNELRPASSYDPMSSSERFMQAGNYNGMGEGIPPSSLPQAPNAFNYLNGHEAGAAAGVKINNLGWMGMPQQNPGIHESSMRKPFLRSWNQ